MSIDRYAVIGEHIGYSRSPQIHTLFAQQTAQAMSYGLIDVAPSALAAAVREFLAGGGRGLNVTVPHKLAAMSLADALTPRAQRAGALNTLAVQADGTLLGDNTDGAGLLRDLTINLKLRLAGARLLLLGAGGAARGVLAPLLDAGPQALVISNRTAARAQLLAAQFADLGPVHVAGGARQSGGHDSDAAFDLIINTTPANAQGAPPALAASAVSTHTLCYDLSYGDADSAFIRWARSAGAHRAVNGLGMLVEQAAESFLLWRGVRPATAPVLAVLRALASA
jgi:shikimate dehydrogenase